MQFLKHKIFNILLIIKIYIKLNIEVIFMLYILIRVLIQSGMQFFWGFEIFWVFLEICFDLGSTWN